MARPLASSTPSTGHTSDRSKELVTVLAVFMISIIVVVSLRFWVRVKMVGKTGLDDWFIGVATVLSLIWCVFIIISVQYGTGKHMVDIPPSDVPIAMKYLFITQPLSILCMWMIKVSIGLFLLRLAATKTYRYICIGFVWLTSFYMLAYGCFMTFKCTPISVNWETTAAGSGGKCTPVKVGKVLVVGSSVIFALSDFFLVLLPIAMLWKAQIPRRQRYMICGIMGAGTVAAAASIVRVSYFRRVLTGGEFLLNITDITIWTAVEQNVGIISASLPALKPLIAKAVEKTMSSMLGEGSSGMGASQAHRLSALRKDGGTQRSNKGGITTDIRANGNRGAENMDNGSEEGIIGISKTTDVRVDVETVSNSSGDIPPADAGARW